MSTSTRHAARIVVANAPESTVVSAAEHTIGLLLALSRNIAQAHAALKDGRWERSSHGGTELAGKTLGVLGFGRIASRSRVARSPWRCESWRTTRSSRASASASSSRPRRVLDDALAAADFLTLGELPLTEETTWLPRRAGAGEDA